MKRDVAAWVRVVILVGAVAALGFLSYRFNGSLLPTNPRDALIFQNALLLVVLGSAIIEHKFTTPADSMVNGLMGAVTLLTVFTATTGWEWWLVFGYCTTVFLLAMTCTAVSIGPQLAGWRRRVADVTYRPAVNLGPARVLFSVVFLYGVFSFYDVPSSRTAALVVFWGIFVVLWPLGVPEFLSSLGPRKRLETAVGRVVRTDWPDVVRVALSAGAAWSRDEPVSYQQSDGQQRWVLPLYSQVQEDNVLGTGLCIGNVADPRRGLEAGYVYEHDEDQELPVSQMLGGGEASKLVGFVIEESDIGEIRLETWDANACSEGMLVWCPIGDEKVFFQITNGVTREESLQADRHGFQVAEAAQLGVLSDEQGFIKYGWLPAMNTPVFAEPEEFGGDVSTVLNGDFVLGTVPRSKIRVGGPFADACDHHTAILGVTGSGKTELAFDLIRYSLDNGKKVICIDLTAQYKDRLMDLDFTDLSVSEVLASELGQRLFDVETGSYGAGQEKQALQEFSARLTTEITESIRVFLTGDDQTADLGIIELNEISNTKATLFITELYLTCLLNYAKTNRDDCPEILIVVEEAHTVMPEPSTMGVGDYDSRGLVGKIAQIALQGRKYAVGLLVLAQRTATVSKTVLTQCNTIISFTCFDDTSLNFLRNVFGKAHIRLIPNLPPLTAVAFGRAVRSQRPIVVEIPYDETKANGTR